jgi:hypothetical protein
MVGFPPSTATTARTSTLAAVMAAPATAETIEGQAAQPARAALPCRRSGARFRVSTASGLE